MNAVSPTGRYDGEIERELIRTMIQRARHSIVANIIGICILTTAAFLVPFGRELTVGVLLRMLTISFTAYNTNRVRECIDKELPVTPAVNRFCLGMVFAGMSWAGLLWVLPLQYVETLSGTLILCVVITGISLVVAVASPLPRVMWSFIAGFLLPLFGWLLMIAPTYGLAPAVTVAGLGLASLSLGAGMGRESVETARTVIEKRELAIQLSQLNEELRATAAEKEHLASHDALTGLPNRRSFEKRVAGIAAGGQSERWSLLLVDLDHFKVINDAAGHAGGDTVLRAMGSLLASLAGALPGEAHAARVGGEEFALLVEGLRDAAVQDVGISLGARCRVIPPPPGYDGRVTASIGITRWAAGEPFDRTFRRADEALYAAKDEGRDRVRRSAEAVADLPYEQPARG
ncbi:GGDEF domain-containing protein [Sphingomicrobium aestuariivivum]|uniref:GGDEF domain-containing protein n=1 Tax=Sphingomicrobium aestuariivivum TaxID=1582356 RepID=UPI001FD64C06|nr:GGDEF domain-containing protein [Sphingomicrobium aestuariivivum]MCJ8190504.1 GGDEF domain-containing protein [Sphingomicrobium aestuariivivum]